ncbi:helix-turn-helix domain-containing protein [Micromonospora lupini]|uniref:helix-turn-helix domain-containing protein n=1 Tax=Micromonospora lupini TaxID=285679 RepID=UPI002259A335|nr:helix-turn-helix domain-containing protein [Micromonospora lupini]MCX5066960.1 helix-turn-helix domain-containing protein [Micromonospora lupini]
MHESATLSSDADGIRVDPAILARLAYKLAYTVPQAAEAIGMGERTLWALVRSGAIRSYKVGASRRISRAALLEFIEQQENAG